MNRPLRKWIGDRTYKATPALVNTRHPDGMPRLITLMQDDTTIHLAGGEEFVIVYVPEIDWKDRQGTEDGSERAN